LEDTETHSASDTLDPLCGFLRPTDWSTDFDRLSALWTLLPAQGRTVLCDYAVGRITQGSVVYYCVSPRWFTLTAVPPITIESDFVVANLILQIRRSVVAMVEGAPKTEASLKDVPLDAQTAASLWAWRHPHAAPGDWVFASPHMKGRQPYWPGTLWRYYGKPALQRAKVTKHVSYHAFRQTFGRG